MAAHDPVERVLSIRGMRTERLAEAGIEPSVGSVGELLQLALAETINGLYKAEVVHRRGPWRNLEAVEFATLEWVDWFNNRRLLEPIGFIPPAEAYDIHTSFVACARSIDLTPYSDGGDSRLGGGDGVDAGGVRGRTPGKRSYAGGRRPDLVG